MPVLTLAEAETLVVDALTRCRTSPANARCVARALVAAEADGLKGHGLSRVPTYAAQAKVAKVDGFATPTMTRPRPATVAIDAGNGFAYPAIDMALANAARGRADAKASPRPRSGARTIAAPPATRSSGWRRRASSRSCSPTRRPPSRLRAERGACSAPIRSRSPAPLPGRAPIVVDLSLSKVARGNILAAQQKGERIPEGWALDAAGRPTTDPASALAGTMVPLGDAKGTALALMVELLAAGLTGANFAAEASSFLDAEGPPPGTGQLIIAFAPAAFGGTDVDARFAALAASIEQQPGARLPGTRRLAARQTAATDGLVIGEALLAEIRSI